MRELLARHRPTAWIGVGLAGSATPGVPAGTLLVARNVGDPAWAGRVLAGGGARDAVAVTLDRIAGSPREKAAFAGAAADGSVVALDLESSGWAAAAGSLSPPVPGLVIRIVSDAADEEIPAFVSRASSPAGVDRRRIALHALAHPSAVGKLLAMRRRARFCAERLAEFLAELAARGFDRP
jgi:nucleoside phosphorylase